MHEFVQSSVFSPRSARFMSFSHWVQHFLGFFSKVHEVVQNSVLRTRSACFVIFALGAPLLSDFQQSARGCTNQRFQPEISTFPHFRTGRTTFKRFSAKCTILYKTAFSAQDQHVFSFSHWMQHFLVFFSAKCTSLYKTAF